MTMPNLTLFRLRRGWLSSLALALGIGTAVLGVSRARAQMPPPTLSPEKIEMGTFYKHARVRIEGTAPSNAGVLVVIRGAEEDEFLNRKGRVGIIWLNTDRIHVQQAPSVFLSFSSAEVGSLLDRASLDQFQLDETAIKNQIRCFCRCKCKLTGGKTSPSCLRGMEPNPAYAELLRTSFLNLKKSEGNYRAYPSTVSLARMVDPGTAYKTEFEWPKTAPPGEYRVEVYACSDHKVVAQSAATLQLVEVGFPAFVANLAIDHSWIYGSGAVLIAMLAGFGIDALTTWIRRPRRGPRTRKEQPLLAAPGVPPVKPKPADVREREVVHRG